MKLTTSLLIAVAGTLPLSAAAQDAAVTQTYRIGAVKWPHRMFKRADAFFADQKTRYAPLSTLQYKLPAQLSNNDAFRPAVRVLPAHTDDATTVDVDAHGVFSLPHPAPANWSDASVIVDGSFSEGHHYPEPLVRSTFLAVNEVRMGDVRLSCRVRVELVRGANFKFNVMLGALGALSLSPCTEESGYHIQAPLPFNKVTYLDGAKVIKVTSFPELRRDIGIPVAQADIPNDAIVRFELAESL